VTRRTIGEIEMRNEIQDVQGPPGDEAIRRERPANPDDPTSAVELKRPAVSIRRGRNPSERRKPARRRASAGSGSSCSDTSGFDI